jgi:hypothetical protein
VFDISVPASIFCQAPAKSWSVFNQTFFAYSSSTIDADDPLFSFGPALKKRRINREDEQHQSISDEFVSFFDEASKKRRKCQDFWALHKKVILFMVFKSHYFSAISTNLQFIKEAFVGSGKHRISRASLLSTRHLHQRPQDELQRQVDSNPRSLSLQS